MGEDQKTELPPLEERPLVTFALFAYNQEKYIREAVEGAFAQTYEPLEIILSDDCSTDRTFEIMQEMAAEYNGKNNIVLNRNKINLGIGSHVFAIHEMSNGAIIVHAAGDDISMKERTVLIVDAYLRQAKPPSMICSNAIVINDEGRVVRDLLPTLKEVVYDLPKCALEGTGLISGCTVAITRELIDRFPKPVSVILAEDVTLMRRAYMSNGIVFIPQKLVHYRTHGAAVSSSGSLPNLLVDWNFRMAKDRLLRFDQFQKDANSVGYRFDSFKLAKLMKTEKLLVDLTSAGMCFSTIALCNSVLFKKFRYWSVVYLARWFPLMYQRLRSFYLRNK